MAKKNLHVRIDNWIRHSLRHHRRRSAKRHSRIHRFCAISFLHIILPLLPIDSHYTAFLFEDGGSSFLSEISLARNRDNSAISPKSIFLHESFARRQLLAQVFIIDAAMINPHKRVKVLKKNKSLQTD